MQTANEAVRPSPSSKPSKGSSMTVLQGLIGGIPVETIWAGLLISAACFWAGYPVSDHLILLYGMWMLWNRNQYWHKWIALFIFTGIGFIAAHRFDLEKVPDWLFGDLLPLMVILAFQWMYGTRRIQGASRAIGRTFARVRLHWIPYTLLAASCTALICGLRWSVYGGSLLLIVLLAGVRRDRWLASGLVMALIYDIVVHLFILKGASFIREGTSLEFLAAHWGTMLFPILALAGTVVARPSRNASSLERLDKELIE